MQKTKKVNCNELVAVRLTPAGRKVYRRYWDNLQKNLLAQRGMKLEKKSVPKLRKATDGWYLFQLNDLMLIFGSEMYGGNTAEPFSGNEIRFTI